MPRRTPTAGRTSDRLGPRSGRSRDVEAQLAAIEKTGGDGEVDCGKGDMLRVTSLGKTYFPEAEITKGALMRYYARLWPFMEPHVRDRPLVLKRYPDGIDGPIFYQQNAGPRVPEAVRVEKVATAGEGPQARIIGGTLATLLYTVQLGAVEVHPWLSRIGDIDAPDRCLIDLDPGDDVPFAAVVSLAKDVVAIAEQCELPVAVKTSGSSGIHLVLPLPPKTSYDISLQLASLIAGAVVALRPDRATVERSIRKRPAGTTYVDAMQNSRGKSMAGPYSVRPRADGTVSMPVRPRELTARLRTGAFTVRSAQARVMRVGDLWGEALAKKPAAQAVRNAIASLARVLET